MYQEEAASYCSTSPIKTVKNSKIKITKVIKKNFNLSVPQPRTVMGRVRPVLNHDVGNKTKYYGIFLGSTKETSASKGVRIFSPMRENNIFYLQSKERQAESSPQTAESGVTHWPVIDISSPLSSSKELPHWTNNTSKYFPWYSSDVKDRPVSTDYPSAQPGESLVEKRQTWYKLPNEYQEPSIPTVSSTTSSAECNSSTPSHDHEVTNRQYASSSTAQFSSGETTRPKDYAPETLPGHAELNHYGIFFEDESLDEDIGDTRGEEVCLNLRDEEDEITEIAGEDIQKEPAAFHTETDPETSRAWNRLQRHIYPYIPTPTEYATVRQEMENDCSDESEELIRSPSDSLTDKPFLIDNAFPSGVFPAKARHFGIHMEGDVIEVDDSEHNALPSTDPTNRDVMSPQPSTERPSSPEIEIIEEIKKSDLSNSSRILREKYMKCLLKRKLENSKTCVGTPVYFFCCLRCFVCIKWKNVKSDQERITSCPFCSKRRKPSS